MTLFQASSQGQDAGAPWVAPAWKTAIFVDYDNVKLYRDVFLSPGKIIEAIRRDLRSVAVVQFGNFYLGMGLPEDPTQVDRGKIYQIHTNGLSPIPTPSFKGSGGDRLKNIADESASVDIVASIFTHPEINSYCLVTCDKDYLPAVRELRRNGKAVRIYYRGQIATVLAAEIGWLNGDGFSSIVDLESLPYFSEIQLGRSNA